MGKVVDDKWDYKSGRTAVGKSGIQEEKTVQGGGKWGGQSSNRPENTMTGPKNDHPAKQKNNYPPDRIPYKEEPK